MNELVKYLLSVNIIFEFIITLQFVWLSYLGYRRSKHTNGLTLSIMVLTITLATFHAFSLWDLIDMFQYLDLVNVTGSSTTITILKFIGRIAIIGANAMLLINMWQSSNLPMRKASRLTRRITKELETIDTKFPKMK